MDARNARLDPGVWKAHARPSSRRASSATSRPRRRPSVSLKDAVAGGARDGLMCAAYTSCRERHPAAVGAFARRRQQEILRGAFVVAEARVSESFETRTIGWGDALFARFCNALVAAFAARHMGPTFKPTFTERTKAKDGGIDARIEAPPSAAEPAGGLCGPGLTIYQYKFQDPALPRAGLSKRLTDEVLTQLPDVLLAEPDMARYVLITNRDLGPGQSKLRAQIAKAIAKATAGSGVKVTVLGGAELGAILSDYPALGFSFGADAVYEPTRERKVRLERSARDRGAPDSPLGRERERAEVLSFLGDPSTRVLILSGPPGIGKTTVVASALADSPEIEGNSYWFHGGASAESPAALSALKAQRAAVFVFDDPGPEGGLEALVRRASETEGLKGIFVLPSGLRVDTPFARALQVGKLPLESMLKLAETAGITDIRQRDWLAFVANGNPGVLLTLAMGLKDAGTLPGDVQSVEKSGLAALARAFVGPDPTRRITGWLAMAGEVDIDDLGPAEGLLPFFGIDELDRAELRDGLELLSSNGVARNFRSRYRFTAPFVVEPLIEERVFPLGDDLERALVALPGSFLPRLLRLLEPFRERGDVRKAAEAIIASPLVDTLDKLETNWTVFVEAAYIAPAEACRHLLRLFRGNSDGLRSLLVKESSWRLLGFLREALSEDDARKDALEALVEASITDGEGEMSGRPVAGRFFLPYWTSLAWWDPPVPLAERLAFASGLATSDDAARRRLGVRCCEAALALHPFDVVSPTGRLRRPVPVDRSIPYSEIREYYAGVVNLLRERLGDPDARVAAGARDSLAGGLRSFLRAGVEAGIIEKALEALRAYEEDAELIRRLLETLRSEAEEVRKASVNEQWKTAVLPVLEREIARLDPVGGFPDLGVEIRFVFGRPPHREAMALWDWSTGSDPDGEAKDHPPRLRALGAVRRAVSNPGQMADDVYTFLESDGSQFAWLFWRLVGVLDGEGRLRSEIERRPLRNAFSWYMAGRSQLDPKGVETYLDGLAEIPSRAEDAFVATWRIEPSPKGATRLAKLARSARVPRRNMAGWLVSGAWLTRVPEERALEVLDAILEDPAANGSPEVIGVLDQFFHAGSKEPSEAIRTLAWRMLEAASPASVSESWTHRLLATRLVERGDLDRGFSFFERVLLSEESRFGWEERELVRSDLGLALATRDRDRMVELILRTVIAKWNELSGLTGGEGVGVVDPARDVESILKAVDGEKGRVRPVLSLFAGTEPGFLDLAARLAEQFGRDEEIWHSLAFCFAFGTVIHGSGAEHVAWKIRELDAFLETKRPGPGATEWFRWMRTYLQRRKVMDEEWEWARAFWDGPGTAADATSLLERDRDDEARRWFVRRLLEAEKRGLARKILGDEEIHHALEHDAGLGEKAREAWEKELRRKVSSWRFGHR